MERLEKDKIRIIVVDDHPLVRYGITQLVNAEPDFRVCCEAEDCRQAMVEIKHMRPDFAIIDLSLKDVNGIELIKDIKTTFPSLPVLVLSMHDEFHYAERAIRAGASGYVMKKEGTETLIKAIRTILSGQVFLSSEMASKLIAKKTALPSRGETDILGCLSDRELQVFELIGKGLKTKQIAAVLNLSIKTIETYQHHIKTKLNIANASELIQQATLLIKSLNHKTV